MTSTVTQSIADNQSSLLTRAQQGDRAALEVLWHEHRRWVAVVLLAHKPASSDLEDLLQDVAMVMLARITDLREPAAFRGWLRMVALNTARAAGRAASSRSMLRLEDPTQEEQGGHGPRCHREPTPGDRVDDRAAHLLGLAGQLPEEYREPLLLRSLQEMSYRQIARLLELPETTIETRITRGRRMLRELAEHGAEHVAGTVGHGGQ